MFRTIGLLSLPVCAELILFLYAGTASVDASCAACTVFGGGTPQGTVSYNSISEASGVAASRRNPGVLWTHNDGSGQGIFALNANGVRLATFDFNRSVDDTEDIAVGPGPIEGVSYLYLGDIGGNTFPSGGRSSVKIVRMPEPMVDLAWAANPHSANFDGVETFTLAYPDGSYDAESLMVDPISGDLFIATKQEVGARLYRANLMTLTNQSTVTMQYVRTISFNLAGGGDISAGGTQIVLRREDLARSWGRCTNETVGAALAAAGQNLPVIGPPTEPNGEGIALLPDGTGYVTISEGQNPVLYFFQARCPAAPQFTLTPMDQSVIVNGSTTFNASAVGYPAPTYHWRFNGQILEGQTNPVLVLSNILISQAGPYEVIATNTSGSITHTATLTVRSKPSLSITEVMSDEASGGGTEDWWELTSFESQVVDLSGCRFNDNSGGLTDSYVFPVGLMIAPGESIVFCEALSSAGFSAWWGNTNLPSGVQIITYAGSGLSFSKSGDGILLWDAETIDPNDIITSVTFGAAQSGVSFNYNPLTAQFGGVSQLGVNGVTRAASTLDIGSPGRIRAPATSPFLKASSVAGKIQIAFDAIAGFRYSLQTRTGLESGIWEPTGDTLQPTNNVSTYFETEISGNHQYYRVVVE